MSTNMARKRKMTLSGATLIADKMNRSINTNRTGAQVHAKIESILSKFKEATNRAKETGQGDFDPNVVCPRYDELLEVVRGYPSFFAKVTNEDLDGSDREHHTAKKTKISASKHKKDRLSLGTSAGKSTRPRSKSPNPEYSSQLVDMRSKEITMKGEELELKREELHLKREGVETHRAVEVSLAHKHHSDAKLADAKTEQIKTQTAESQQDLAKKWLLGKQELLASGVPEEDINKFFPKPSHL